jgi:hypothetical protein
MRVVDLITALQGCDPEAIVLIPAVSGLSEASEPVVDVTQLDASAFSSNAAARCGAIRLTGFPLMFTVREEDSARLRE